MGIAHYLRANKYCYWWAMPTYIISKFAIVVLAFNVNIRIHFKALKERYYNSLGLNHC